MFNLSSFSCAHEDDEVKNISAGSKLINLLIPLLSCGFLLFFRFLGFYYIFSVHRGDTGYVNFFVACHAKIIIAIVIPSMIFFFKRNNELDFTFSAALCFFPIAYVEKILLLFSFINSYTY